MATNTVWIVIVVLLLIVILALVINQSITSKFLAFNVGDCRTTPCPSGSYCGTDFKCYPGKLGDPCQSSTQCRNGLFCNNGFCQPTASPINQVIPPPSSGTTNAATAANAAVAANAAAKVAANNQRTLGNNTVGLGGTCRLGMRDCAPGFGCGIDLKCIPLGPNTTNAQNTAKELVNIAQTPASLSPIQLLQMTPLNSPRILAATHKPNTSPKSNSTPPSVKKISKSPQPQKKTPIVSRRTTTGRKK